MWYINYYVCCNSTPPAISISSRSSLLKGLTSWDISHVQPSLTSAVILHASCTGIHETLRQSDRGSFLSVKKYCSRELDAEIAMAGAYSVWQ